MGSNGREGLEGEEGGKNRTVWSERKLIRSLAHLRFVDGTEGTSSNFLEEGVLLVRVRAHL